jgi:hypothetical protein
MNLKKILPITVLTGLASLIALGITDQLSEQTKVVRDVKTRVNVVGIVSPFSDWDVFYSHELTFSDGTKATVRTNDFHYFEIKRLLGYQTSHPKEGDVYKVGKIFHSARKP